MRIKNIITLRCCYDFVFYILSWVITISTFIMVFYTLNFKFELAPISFQFGYLLLSSEKVFKVHCNRIFANRHPELFTVLPDDYKDLLCKDQQRVISVYIICATIVTLYLLMQEKWFMLLCFLALSVPNLVIDIGAMKVDNLIITESYFHYLEHRYGF